MDRRLVQFLQQRAQRATTWFVEEVDGEPTTLLVCMSCNRSISAPNLSAIGDRVDRFRHQTWCEAALDEYIAEATGPHEQRSLLIDVDAEAENAKWIAEAVREAGSAQPASFRAATVAEPGREPPGEIRLPGWPTSDTDLLHQLWSAIEYADDVEAIAALTYTLGMYSAARCIPIHALLDLIAATRDAYQSWTSEAGGLQPQVTPA